MPIPIILPKFGFTLESSTIVQWFKQAGDTVRAGDALCEVTTDKVNMEVEAPEAGTIYGLRYGVGDEVRVTEVICYLARPSEEIPADPIVEEESSNTEATLPASTTADANGQTLSATPIARRVAESQQVVLNDIHGTGPHGRIMRRDVESTLSNRATPVPVPDANGKVRATPAARHLADEQHVALEQVQGSGPRQRIQAADVAAVAAHHAQSAAQLPTITSNISLNKAPISLEHETPTIIKLTGMRKTIATRLQRSFQTAPHFFVEVQAETHGIDSLRAKLKARQERLSVTSIIVKACATVLQRHPYVNATLNEDELSLWPTVNVGVAVSLPDGLVVPVIHHVERLSLQATQQRLDEITDHARQNRLAINDVLDGTFTVSNMGMYGVDRFTAIINPPQVAILAVGRTCQQFVPDDKGQPVLRSFINLVLSADHRVVDGATAVQFLADLKQVLEEPALILW